jgi:hypothetical protein
MANDDDQIDELLRRAREYVERPTATTPHVSIWAILRFRAAQPDGDFSETDRHLVDCDDCRRLLVGLTVPGYRPKSSATAWISGSSDSR